MRKFVWLNPYLPQTLQISVFLGYAHGVFAILGLIIPGLFGRYTSFGYLLIALGIAGAFGIANVRWWGYLTLLPVAIISMITFNGFLTEIVPVGIYFEAMFSRNNLLNLIFEVAIIALLLHPESRKFVKDRFEKTIP